jgi:glycosyltransferase involved in cell wall biosynthesis
MPLFSIVIPTRNREHLLRYALQSALDQTFEDYEIVVSDNFSDASTYRIVQELADGRVRYVRTDKTLSPC